MQEANIGVLLSFVPTEALHCDLLFKVHRLLLLAKIKGIKVYFGKLVTFLGEGGQFTPYLPPRPPRRCL